MSTIHLSLSIFFVFFVLTPLLQAQSTSCYSQCQATASTSCIICYNTCRTPIVSQPNIYDDHFIFTACKQKSCLKQDSSTGNCTEYDEQPLSQSNCVQTCCNYPHSFYFTLSNLRECIFTQETLSTATQPSTSIMIFICLLGGAIIIALMMAFIIFKIRKYLADRESIKPISQPSRLNPTLSTQTELSVNSSALSTILKTRWVKSESPLKDNELMEICSICLENGMNCRTECGHIFHLVCLKEWINKNADCPLCKSRKFNDVRVYCLKCRCREGRVELKRRMRVKLGSGNSMSCDECRNNRIYNENSWMDLNSIE